MQGIAQLSDESPHKGPIIWSFDVCFALSLNKLLKTITCLRHHSIHVISTYWHGNWTLGSRVKWYLMRSHWPVCSLNHGKYEFENCFGSWYFIHFLQNYHQVNATRPIDDKSTLVRVVSCCHQATSHYLNQCRQRSVMQYDIIRPQWA